MAYVLKKIHVAIMIVLLTAVGQVYGDYGNSSIDGECEDSYCCASACCGKGFICADLLYWRACQGGLDDCFPLTASDYVSSDGDVISRFRGKGEDPRFKWDPGFRIGAGYEFGCWDRWGIAVFWTHFNTNSKRHFKDDYELTSRHELRWKLDFDVVDVVVGREFDAASCFTLTPFGGLRFARIEQKLHSNFESRKDSCADSYVEPSSEFSFSDLSPIAYSTDHFTTSRAHNKGRFLGIGPLIGVEADWNLGCGFSLYANASVAVLYGNFHIRSNEANYFGDGADFCEEKRHSCACQAVVDAGLGIRWQTVCFCDNIVWLQLGLEHHRYFNQNRFGHYGDLCLDGGNFSVGITY